MNITTSELNISSTKYQSCLNEKNMKKFEDISNNTFQFFNNNADTEFCTHEIVHTYPVIVMTMLCNDSLSSVIKIKYPTYKIDVLANYEKGTINYCDIENDLKPYIKHIYIREVHSNLVAGVKSREYFCWEDDFDKNSQLKDKILKILNEKKYKAKCFIGIRFKEIPIHFSDKTKEKFMINTAAIKK